MIRDITIGQHFPGNSPVHRCDPRLKILLVIAYIVILFTVTNFLGLALSILLLVGLYLMAHIPLKLILKSLKPIMPIVVFTAVLNLFFMEPMSSIPLPLYFMLIAAFALGALLSVCFLVWDKMHGTARFMKARWRINQLEREVEKLQKQLTAEGKKQSFFQRARQGKDGVAQDKPAEKPAEAPADKPANTKPLETTAKEAEAAASVEDIVAPDPDKP